jgi:uncharacterized protein (TIGR02453 family)
VGGFSAATIDFLTDLRANNDRDWFAANRHRYEADWLAPAVAFVTTVTPQLQTLVPAIQGEPRIDGSIFRIRRDTRFAADKRPYKDHLDLWWWEGDRQTAPSGLYLRLTADRLRLAVGATAFDRDRLRRYRGAVVEPDAGEELLAAVKPAGRGGWDLRGETLKQGPRGLFVEDPGRARLLRHGALWAALEVPHPGVLGSPARLASWCLRRWEQQLPLHRWLVDHLGA